jgi:tetratricopeptide (TPR) repeat protein
MIILLLSGNSQAQIVYNPSYVYDSTDSLLWRGMAHIYHEDFDSGLATFDSVIQVDTTSPRGYFFVAAAYSNLTGDYKNMSYAPLFFKHVDRAIEIGERKVASGRATAEDLFYYGGAVGYRGIFRSFTGDWFGAFKDGLRGRRLLRKSFEADSLNRDIYLGLGTYDYWRSAMTKILWWLPFFADEREKGIEETWIAVREGKFAIHEAEFALIRMYYNYKKYDDLFKIWETRSGEVNPSDPYGSYWVGLGYIEVKQYDRALDFFENILADYLRSPYYDPGGELMARYYIGLCFFGMNRLDEAERQLRICALMAPELQARRDISDALDNVSALLQDIENKQAIPEK